MKFVPITIHVLLCILKVFLLSLDIFRRHLVLNICWLQKQTTKGNNDIFLVGDDALGYLTKPMHK